MRYNIRTFLLIGFLFTFPVAVSHAQIFAGVKAGLNLNHTNFQNLETYHPGGQAGAFGYYELTGFLSLNAEIMYSQTGGGYDSGYYYIHPEIFRQNVKVTFHSVAVPIFISATLPSLAASSVKPMVMAGAEYAYAFRVAESFENRYRYRGAQYVSGERSRNATNDYHAHQPSMVFGAGVSVSLFGKPTAIDVRYKSTFRKSEIPNGDSARFKALSVNVGVTLF